MNFILTILNYLKKGLGWFFSQDIRNIIIELLAGTVIILFLVLHFRKPVQYVNLPNVNKIDSLQIYKDKNGKLYEQIQSLNLQADELHNIIDSIAKPLGIKSNTVVSQDKYVTKTIVKDSNIVVTVDKHENKTFATSTPYVDIDVEIDSSNQGSFYLSLLDTLTRIETIKKPLFGPTVHTIYLRNVNPYNHIQQGNSFDIQEKKIWLTIGPSIQYDILPKKGFTFGVSAQFPLIKIR
jgi:hypothetical protein